MTIAPDNWKLAIAAGLAVSVIAMLALPASVAFWVTGAMVAMVAAAFVVNAYHRHYYGGLLVAPAMNLTKYGIWTSYPSLGRENASEAARLVEQLGFGTFWLGGSEEPEQLRPLLEATGGLVTATGITNIWASKPGSTLPPETTATAFL